MPRRRGRALARLCVLLLGLLILPPPTARPRAQGGGGWWDPDGVSVGSDWHYRVPVEVESGSPGSSVRVSVDFGALLDELGVSGDFDENSVRVISPSGSPVPNQAFSDETFEGSPDALNNGRGDVTFQLDASGPGVYYIYFDVVENGLKPPGGFAPPAPGDLIQDGGFESAAVGEVSPGAWVGGGVSHSLAAHRVVSGSDPHLGGSVAHSGTKSYKIGWDYSGWGPSSAYASIGGWVYQEVTIPESGAVLSFWRRIVTYDYSPYDTFDVQVRDSSGHVLKTLLHETAPCCGVKWKERPWKQFTYDLSEFAGQTVRIYFRAGNTYDGLYGTYVYVDDVRVAGWIPGELGEPEGFHVRLEGVADSSNPGGPIRRGAQVLITASSEVGSNLDSSTGDYLTAEVYDPNGTLVGSTQLTDDGAGADAAADDGVYSGYFDVPGDADPGAWTVKVYAGPAASYDNGYVAQDAGFFVVEGLLVNPPALGMTVVENTTASAGGSVTNAGAFQLDHVKFELATDLALETDPTVTIDRSKVTFDPQDFAIQAQESVNFTVNVSVPIPQQPGVYRAKVAVFADENLNDLPDDPEVTYFNLTVEVVAPLVAGMIEPDTVNENFEVACGENFTRLYLVLKMTNLAEREDMGDISITSNRDWRVEVYRDAQGDDEPGFYTSPDQFNFSDDVLIAYDEDGDAGGDLVTNSTWDWVNQSEDTFRDNIPDTGMLGNQTSPDNWVNLVFVVYVNNSEVLAGESYHLIVRGTSYNDWVEDPSYPNIVYDDDSLYHDTAHLTANALETPCGFISPDSMSASGAPEWNITLWFVQDWVNRAPMTDRGNVKILQAPGGVSVYLYRDEGLNDPVGSHSESPLDSDDVLLAADYDGDGSWDYVAPEHDTGADGIPDTGDLPPHGGYARMVFGISVPRASPPGSLEVVVRGCSNWEWVNRHPDLEYCDDEIFHDEATMDVEVLAYTRPDLRGTLNLTLGLSGDDVYEDPAETQLLNTTSNPASPANFTLSIQNDGNVPDTLRVVGPPGAAHVEVEYLLDGVNVTDQVTGGGLELALDPGEDSLMTVLMTPTTYQHLLVEEIRVNATSAGDPSRSDSFRLMTTIVDEAAPEVDLLEPGDQEEVEWAMEHTFRARVWDDTGLENATLRIMLPDRTVVMEVTKQVSGRNATVEWTVGQLTAGEYVWAVEACDNVSSYGPYSSNCGLSEHRSFTVLPMPPPPGAVISGSVDAVPDRAPAGDSFDVVVRVSNGGEVAADRVEVELRFPEGVRPAGACTLAGGGAVPTVEGEGSLWVELGRLPPGETARVSCEFSVQPWAREGTYVISEFFRGVLLDSTSLEVVSRRAPAAPTAARAVLLLELGLDPESVEVGGTSRLDVRLRNVGGGRSEGLTITVELPDGLEFVPGSLTLDGSPVAPTVEDGAVSWAVGYLGPGEAVEASMLVRAGEAGSHEIRACAGEVCSSAELSVSAPREVTVHLSTSSQVSEGGLVRVTVEVDVRGGDVGPTDFVVSVPEGLELVEGSLSIDGRAVRANLIGRTAVVSGVTLAEGRHEVEFTVDAGGAPPGEYSVGVSVAGVQGSAEFQIAAPPATEGPARTGAPSPPEEEKGLSPTAIALAAILLLGAIVTLLLRWRPPS